MKYFTLEGISNEGAAALGLIQIVLLRNNPPAARVVVDDYGNQLEMTGQQRWRMFRFKAEFTGY